MASSGGDVLRALGTHLEVLGDGELRTKVHNAIHESMREVEWLIVLRALTILPKRGGLAKWVSTAPIYERSTRFGTWIIQSKTGHDLKDLNRGRLSHPVFGNTDNWVRQTIPKGYFSETIEANLYRIQKRIEDAAFKALRGE